MAFKPRITREVAILSAVSAVAVGIGVLAANFITQDAPPQDQRESSEASAESDPMSGPAAPPAATDSAGGAAAQGEEPGADPAAPADAPGP
jgi:hypothetical protein